MLDALRATLCAVAASWMILTPAANAADQKATGTLEQIKKDIQDENPSYWKLKVSVTREGEGWLAKIVATNISERPRFIRIGGSMLWLFDIIPTFAGVPVKANVPAIEYSGAAGNIKHIPPGGESTYTVRLDEFFYLRQKGPHELTVRYRGLRTSEEADRGVEGVDFVSAKTTFEIH
jgi:hypothetical protein